MAGTLALVVGPSGVGKDTLIAAARERLAHDPRFIFARRLVTRDAVAALEDHETISRDAFAAGRRRGDFALSWEAHGLAYALPKSIESEMAAGRVVVANVSRQIIVAALARYAGCRVLMVDADSPVRAARLAARGRESAGDVAARLRREVSEMPLGIEVTRIDNSGALEHGIAAFIAALESIAA